MTRDAVIAYLLTKKPKGLEDNEYTSFCLSTHCPSLRGLTPQEYVTKGIAAGDSESTLWYEVLNIFLRIHGDAE